MVSSASFVEGEAMRSIRRSWVATMLCGAMFLSGILLPGSARANGSGEDRPIRLYGTAHVGPIGVLSNDNLKQGSVKINGQAASAGQPVWSGDLVQSDAGARVSVSLDSIGAISLAGGAHVRLAAGRFTQNDGSRALTLIASLARGEMTVDLEQTAGAYLRAAGSAYACSQGAVFKASVKEGRAFIAVKSGEVRAEPQAAQHQYTIRPVGHDSKIRVEASELTTLRVQVMEDDKPVPGVGVLFALDTSAAIIGLLGMGTLSGTTANVVTGSDGIAAVQFVARDSSGTSPISATVEGTRVAWTGEIRVTSNHDSHGSKWGYAVLAGAAAAAGIGWALTRSDKDPLQAEPPVVKNP
jgi:hypothetical protein